MRRAIYPGSFDPVTNGHLDVVERARKLFDEVIVAVAYNEQKQPLFSLDERLELLRATIGDQDGVQFAPMPGLLVDFAVERNATAVVRGLRAVSDFETSARVLRRVVNLATLARIRALRQTVSGRYFERRALGSAL